jgi:hypothetical protein
MSFLITYIPVSCAYIYAYVSLFLRLRIFFICELSHFVASLLGYYFFGFATYFTDGSD